MGQVELASQQLGPMPHQAKAEAIAHPGANCTSLDEPHRIRWDSFTVIFDL
jgi:hypothetical protein